LLAIRSLEGEREEALQQRDVLTTGVSVLEKASFSTRTTETATERLALSAAFGLLLGVGFAFLLEKGQSRIGPEEDVERLTGAQLLASVPAGRGLAGPASPAGSTGSVGEPYRMLRTNLEFLARRDGVKTILVTSALAGEGKTLTTANLGLAFSHAGRKVLLVSGDLRLPRLEQLFEIQAEQGLATVLAAEDAENDRIVGWARDLVREIDPSGLELLPSGTAPANPAELLARDRVRMVVDALRPAYDFVLFDSSPILPVADAAILASVTDGVLLIVDGKKATPDLLLEASQRLHRVGAHIVGVVTNRTPGGPIHGYG
jgi:receptor protein-tyrosine kinase